MLMGLAQIVPPFTLETIRTLVVDTMQARMSQFPGQKDMSAAVASVGSTKIPYQDYVLRVNQCMVDGGNRILPE